MIPDEVLTLAAESGLILTVDNERLIWKATAKPPESLLDIVREHKRALIDHLSQEPDQWANASALEAQHEEDRDTWLEMKRIFGDAFPASDSLAPLVDRPLPSPDQAAVIQRFREDENRIRYMIRTGELSADPMPIPCPSRMVVYDCERRARERRQQATAIAGKDRPLAVPLGYEGPSAARHRQFMSRDGFVIDVPRGAYLDHDSTRLLILATREGQDALASLEDARIEFPGVYQESGLITVRCEPGYHPEVTLWSRRLVLDLERQGMRFDASASELIVTHDGDVLDDQTLGLVLPRAEIIKSALLERSPS